jgi:hypothetical protein
MDRPDQLEYFGALNRLMGVASPRPTDTSTASSNGPSGAVIGGAVGGAVFLLAIIGVLVFFLCRRRRRKQRLASAAEASEQDGAAPAAAAMKQNKGVFATASPQAGGLSRTYTTLHTRGARADEMDRTALTAITAPPTYSPEQRAYYQGTKPSSTPTTATTSHLTLPPKRTARTTHRRHGCLGVEQVL